jgi:two-component system sensor histidine kinase KdpD
MSPAQLNLLETFANGLGIAVERTMLARESHEARIQAESEKMRNALLSSISHDLRTPLTSIAGAASSLRDGKGDSKQLADTIYQESIRLNFQVQNLLDMTRLQSGDVALKLDWQSLEELVGTALERTKDLLGNREVTIKMPEDLPLVYVDGQLIEKVVTNLLENVVAHTPEGSPIDISARAGISYIVLDVADRGAGIPKGEETKIFERFFQREARMNGGGFGLGLAICRAVMRLHDGQIWAENRRDGPGAVFHVEIPRQTQPEVPRG